MFGLFYQFFKLGAKGAVKINDAYQDASARARAQSEGDDTYYGYNGLRLTSNGRKVAKKRLIVNGQIGDRVLIDCQNGTIYRNYSEEERQRKEKQMDERGDTVERMWFRYHEPDEIKQSIIYKYRFEFLHEPAYYRDRKTGCYYTTIELNSLIFYMDIETNRLVRLEDHPMLAWKIGRLEIDKLIEYFNKYQEELENDPRFNKNGKWMCEVYYGKGGRTIRDNGTTWIGDYNTEMRKWVDKTRRENKEKYEYS